jgi:hypothetical protein
VLLKFPHLKLAFGGGLYSVVPDLEDVASTVAEIWKAEWGVFVPDDGESFASEIHFCNTQGNINLHEITQRVTGFGAVILPLLKIDMAFMPPSNPLVAARI